MFASGDPIIGRQEPLGNDRVRHLASGRWLHPVTVRPSVPPSANNDIGRLLRHDQPCPWVIFHIRRYAGD